MSTMTDPALASSSTEELRADNARLRAALREIGRHVSPDSHIGLIVANSLDGKR